MNTGIRCCLTTAVLSAALGAAEPTEKIAVVIYNYAAVAPGLLAQAEAEAARIYQHCRIEFRWLDCPLTSGKAGCQISLKPTWLALRILPQTMAERVRLSHEGLGFAPSPEDGSFAIVANVFAHDAEQLGTTSGIAERIILGHVMAHELGHLLLGAGSHSDTGIMHASWRSKELKIIAQGRMTFTPGEAERMRTNIRARMMGQHVNAAALTTRR